MHISPSPPTGLISTFRNTKSSFRHNTSSTIWLARWDRGREPKTKQNGRLRTLARSLTRTVVGSFFLDSEIVIAGSSRHSILIRRGAAPARYHHIIAYHIGKRYSAHAHEGLPSPSGKINISVMASLLGKSMTTPQRLRWFAC